MYRFAVTFIWRIKYVYNDFWFKETDFGQNSF